jgi:two-component system chemotaxis response regulator CheB
MPVQEERAGALPLEIIVVGASLGGLHALRRLVSGFPASWPAPVAIVQHRSHDSELLCDLLQDFSALRVAEVLDKQPVVAGIYIAPPGYHLLVERGYFALSTDEPVQYSRPSIDLLFGSAADSYGAAAAGVVLTGANSDGAAGLRRLARRGGYAIVQDPRTAEAPTMPGAALKAVPLATALPLEEIAPHLLEMVTAGSTSRPDARSDD